MRKWRDSRMRRRRGGGGGREGGRGGGGGEDARGGEGGGKRSVIDGMRSSERMRRELEANYVCS